MTSTAGVPGSATDRMSAAEFRVLREFLGLTTRWMAEHLDVAERTVHRWEDGTSPIPLGVQVEVRELAAFTGRIVDGWVAAHSRPRVNRAMQTYRTDTDYHATHQPGGGSWSASWHRAMTARVAERVPGLDIEYWAPRDPRTTP